MSLALVSFLIACGAPAIEPVGPNAETHKFPALGYSLAWDPSWDSELAPFDKKHEETLVVSPERFSLQTTFIDQLPCVLVSLSVTSPPFTPSTFVADDFIVRALDGTAVNAGPGGTVHHRFEPAALNDTPFLVAAFSQVTRDGTMLEVERYVTQKGGRQYWIDVQAPADQWDELAPSLRGVIDTIRLMPRLYPSGDIVDLGQAASPRRAPSART